MKNAEYKLNCDLFPQSFNSLEKLIEAVIDSGADPNYELIINGIPQGHDLIEVM